MLDAKVLISVLVLFLFTIKFFFERKNFLFDWDQRASKKIVLF